MRRGSRPWSDEDLATAFEMREAGKCFAIIANKLGRTQAAVQTAMTKRRTQQGHHAIKDA